MTTYDEIYAVTKHDEYRTCSNIDRRGNYCGKRYRQWSKAQDNEPLSWCFDCMLRETAPKKGKKKNARQADND